MTALTGSYKTVAIDPLFDDGSGAIVELCERFGRYRTYAEPTQLQVVACR